ncbi:hypothetical protein GARC_4362 [Paraglaciecola arctica BSs20135]|uniref:Uncharacterized protein n=1 Tax=Paraglaciecola arctica BSs20135 TaxID=493475 RepID=K6XKZ5_9ALTE|nr:hypothetical protein GARC_4362 [Paraglaciecola arctica BSs20135]
MVAFANGLVKKLAIGLDSQKKITNINTPKKIEGNFSTTSWVN